MADKNAMVSNPPFPKCYAPDFLVLQSGKGCRLTDAAGSTYLDFGGGIAVNSLGYGRDDLADVAAEQMRRLIHVSNLWATEPALALAETLVASGPWAAVQFQNSGSEAIEVALKYARMYALRTRGEGHHRILSFTNAFHGRTMGALSCTPTPKYQEPFGPLVPGMEVCPYNDVEALKRTLSDEFAGVIVEVVQGEGGLDRISPDFSRALNEQCRKYDVVLIADEVQTGLGRTGTLYASQGVGLEPDMTAIAKPLAAGLPLSAVLIPQKINDLIHVGEHGTTFGGGPVTTAVAREVWKIISDEGFLREVRRRSEVLRGELDGLAVDFPFLGRVKGSGMLVGVEVLTEQIADRCGDEAPMSWIMSRCRDAGLLILRSGVNILRIAPPLVIGDAEIAEGVGIMRQVMQQLQ